MKLPFKSSLLLACLVIPSFGSASTAPSSYERLNTLLKSVHDSYLVRDFDAIDEVRSSFINEYESFDNQVKSGKIKLSSSIQSNDYKLASSYHRSLTVYYDALKKKYSKAPKSQNHPPKIIKNDVEPLIDPKTRDIYSILTVKKDPSLEVLTESPELKEALIGLSDLETQEMTENDVDESILKLDIPSPFDEEKVEIALTKLYENKYGKKLPPPDHFASNELPPEIPEEALIPPIPSELGPTPEKTIKIARDPAKRREKVSTVYKAEAKLINEGLEKIRVLKENQARFEMNIIKNNSPKKIDVTVDKPTKRPPVFTHDRLSEDDDDVIIISFPRSK